MGYPSSSTFSSDDENLLDSNAVVQEDDQGFNPNAEPSRWTGDPGYDFSSSPFSGGNNNFNFDDQLSNLPVAGWNQNGTNWGNVDQQLGTSFDSPAQKMYDLTQNMGGGASNVLSQLFSGKGGITGLAALLEGYQNKKKASNIQNIVQQQQQRVDPFGSQRATYQQALANTIQDPYSQPIVKAQTDALAKAQAIKDAAAGRRSNNATSSPALLAAQAQIAQNYMNSLYTPAGANISPSTSGMNELINGSNASVNGYLSPLMSAIGYNKGTSSNNDAMSAILAALKKYQSGE